MNAMTLMWKQILKGLKLFQMKENKEDATEKVEKTRTKPAECCGDIHIDSLTDTELSAEKEKKEKKGRDGTKTTRPADTRGTRIPAKAV